MRARCWSRLLTYTCSFYVLFKCPRLRVLDGQPVTQAELQRIAGKQIEAPLPLPVQRVLTPLDKDELGFAVAHEGELTMFKHAVPSPLPWHPDYFVLGERRLMRYPNKEVRSHSLTLSTSPVRRLQSWLTPSPCCLSLTSMWRHT